MVFACSLLLGSALMAAEPLRVMSFNVRNSNAQDGENVWSKRTTLFFDTIEKFGPDLIGFQEVLADQHDAITARLTGYAFCGVARNDGKRSGEWSMLGYRKDRFTEVAHGDFWLSETPDVIGSKSWDAAITRICSWARLRENATGREFLYANTHFDHKGVVAREKSSRLLTTKLTELGAGGPVILTGDFNIDEDNPAYAVLVRPETGDTIRWTDSYREVHTTRQPDEASFHGFKGGKAGSRIDFVFHTAHFKATAATIEQAVPVDGRWASDHYAVTAVLEWAPPAAPTAARGGAQRDPKMDAFYKLGPDSQKQEGIPEGKFVGPIYLPSQVFPDVKHTYFVYVPAQYDPKTPCAVMIFNDGQAMMAEPGDVQGHRVLDNLIFRREIPVMIGVFINPGRRPGQPEPTPKDWGDRTTIRKEEYDVPTDIYARVMVDELMPALKKDYNISPDPNLHGIMGASSGGIAAFLTAWFRPDDFHKVISIVGSFTNIKGGHVFPEKVLESEKKPIRIFMQDGRNDNRRPDAPDRDWFYQNVRLKDALEKKGYDLNYTWGIGNHGQKQGGAIFPEMMRWLWRDQPVSTDANDKVERAFRTGTEAH